MSKTNQVSSVTEEFQGGTFSTGEIFSKEEVVKLNSESCSTISGLRAYAEFEKQAKECLGELLTIVDATYGEERQNKAMKDVVKKTFYRMLSKSQTFCSNMDAKDGASWGNSINL